MSAVERTDIRLFLNDGVSVSTKQMNALKFRILTDRPMDRPTDRWTDRPTEAIFGGFTCPFPTDLLGETPLNAFTAFFDVLFRLLPAQFAGAQDGVLAVRIDALITLHFPISCPFFFLVWPLV